MPPTPPRRSSRPDESALLEARLWDQLQHKIDGIKAGLEVHVLAVVRAEVAPIAAKLEEVLTRVRLQDERERIREEERERARNEERGHTNRAFELAGAVDKSIDGRHKRRVASITAFVAIATLLTGGGAVTLISHLLNR